MLRLGRYRWLSLMNLYLHLKFFVLCVHFFVVVQLVKNYLVWFSFYINLIIAFGISYFVGMNHFNIGKRLE